MNSGAPLLRCKVVFRSGQVGGRTSPLGKGALKSKQYRPHFVLGEKSQLEAIVGPGNELTEEYLGVQFEDGPDEFAAGEEIEVEVRLIYFEHADQGSYSGLIPGAGFTIREGARIVGHGTAL